MKDYTGKNVFVGIDVHKKTYSVVAVSNELIIKKATIEAKPEKIVSFLKKNFPGAILHTAYEAGFSGFHLHRHLINANIDNKVVHAASIEISARDRVKTDKRDALKIAMQLQANRLSGIYVPDETREDYRELTRFRESLVEEKTSIAIKIKSYLYRYGKIEFNDKRRVSIKWITTVLDMDLNINAKYCIEMLCNQWLDFRKKIAEIDEKIKEQSKLDSEIEAVYESAPGFGPTISRTMANELLDMSHFSNGKKLNSFTGLTPSESSSGEHIRRGHISHQGRSIIRKMLILAAWKAIKLDTSLKRKFDSIKLRAGAKKAIVAVARTLIGRIRACFMKGTLYCYH